jgi:hypothetical protein
MALLLLNSFFYCLYYNICIWQRKAEVREQITAKDFGSFTTIIKTPLSNIDVAAKDEIWYNNSLYDVIKKQRVHDTLYVYIMRDEDEENLVNRIDACINADDQLVNYNCTVHREANNVKIASQHYLCPPVPPYFGNASLAGCFSFMQQTYYSVIAEIITPPPKPGCVPYCLFC